MPYGYFWHELKPLSSMVNITSIASALCGCGVATALIYCLGVTMEYLIYVLIGTPAVIAVYTGLTYMTLLKFGDTGK